MTKAIFYTLVFLAVQVLFPLLVNTMLELFTDKVPEEATLMIIQLSASSVVTLALFLSLRWAEVSRSYVRSRPWDVLFWCVIAAMGAVIPSLWIQEQMPELPNIVEKEFGMILSNRWGYFAVGLMAPVCEELVFRGAVLRALLSWVKSPNDDGCSRWKGAWTAIVISAVLFALIHGNPAQMPHAFVIGLLLGWLYYRTDSVVPGVVYHWVNNTISYVGYNLYPNPDLKLIDLLGSQRSVAAAVFFSLLILLPALYQLNQRLRKAL